MNSKYNFEKYVYPSHWMSYWYQIKEVLALRPQKILEIGIGNKTVCNYLRSEGIDITTFDIDEKLNPDVVGSVTKIPFGDNSFDAILCAEVLEHLPFDKFEETLRELKRASKRYIILSLPHFGPQFKLSFKIPFLREKRFAFKIYFPIKHKFNGEHYWEMGKRGYSSKKIKDIIRKYFKIKKEFIPFENQYHHFFVLEK